jgi:predicted DNA-binding protein
MKAGFSSITLIVNNEFKDAIKRLASQKGRNVSNYVTWIISREIERNKTSTHGLNSNDED